MFPRWWMADVTRHLSEDACLHKCCRRRRRRRPSYRCVCGVATPRDAALGYEFAGVHRISTPLRIDPLTQTWRRLRHLCEEPGICNVFHVTFFSIENRKTRREEKNMFENNKRDKKYEGENFLINYLWGDLKNWRGEVKLMAHAQWLPLWIVRIVNEEDSDQPRGYGK